MALLFKASNPFPRVRLLLFMSHLLDDALHVPDLSYLHTTGTSSWHIKNGRNTPDVKFTLSDYFLLLSHGTCSGH